MSRFYTAVEKRGKYIFHVWYENGKRKTENVEYYPTLHVASNKGKAKTLDGVRVAPIMPGDMKECSEYIQKNSTHNFKIYGNTNYIATFIADEYPDYCDADMSVINIGYLDIEVASDKGFPQPDVAASEITAITIKHSNDNLFYTWALGDFKPNSNDNVLYCKCSDELELLELFMQHWEHYTPDIITGWNIEGFDLPYIFNRIERLFEPSNLKRFSMFRIAPRCEKNKYGEFMTKIVGTTCLDYLSLFRKFGYSYSQPENYKLDTIGYLVVGEKKLDYSEYANLHQLYLNDHQKFIEYNIKDVQLVERIEEKAGLIQLALTLAHKANSTYNSTLGSVRIWETYIYNVLKRADIILPNAPEHVSDRSIQGGYVKEPAVGAHKWIVSFDLQSLYPHLIMQYNLSPEQLGNFIPGADVDDILNGKPLPNIPKDHCYTPGGQTSRVKNKGMLPTIIDDLYSQRSVIKKQMLAVEQEMEDLKAENRKQETLKRLVELDRERVRLNGEQMALKIFLNSCYGALSNKYFRYYNANMAEAITLSGQLTIRWSEKAVNEYLQKVIGDKKDRIIAIDTDSIYVCLDDFIEKYQKNTNDEDRSQFVDKMAKQALEPVLEKAFHKLAGNLNAYEQRMVMKREAIASKMIITGKKRYIANVLNNEGVQYARPKMKITGIESVRSSTPMYCRGLIEDTLNIIMNEDEKTLQKHVADNLQIFKKLPVEDVSFPRGVNDISKYLDNAGFYVKGTPIAVRGAILYNRLKTEDAEPITNKDKIKFTYLKMPNPIGENVIGFLDILPKEFGLHDYVDFDMQYQKSFVDPINSICTAIGWSTEKRNTLEDFFS
jgi:DNA polymerase elongation subunit (family B)